MTGESGPVESVTGVTHAQPEPEKTLIGGVLDKLKDTSTVTPSVVESPVAQVLSNESDDWYSKEMRGVSTGVSAESVVNSSGKICNGCGWNNSDTASYCENCGNKL